MRRASLRLSSARARCHSIASSLFMTGPHLAVVIGLALGGWIAQQYGWRATFIFFGAPGIVLGLLVWLFVKEPVRGGFDAQVPTPAESVTATATPIATASAPATESLWQQVLRLMTIPAFRWVGLACGMAGLAGYAYGVWTPSVLVRTHGLSLAHAGLMFGVASGFGALAGGLSSGWLCDRLVVRDVRWQLGLPLIGVLVSIPCAIAFLLWPTAGFWQMGSLKVPHAMMFASIFGAKCTVFGLTQFKPQA